MDIEISCEKPIMLKLWDKLEIVCLISIINIPCVFNLFQTDRVRIMDGDGGPRLKLNNVTSEDNVVHPCKAENVTGAVDSEHNFILNVKGE